MKTIILLLFVGLVMPGRLIGGDGSLVGVWAGGFEHGADYVFLQLDFKTKDGKLSGTYDAPLLFQKRAFAPAGRSSVGHREL